jgi:tyrosine-protein kinase Etk/Wzc
MKKQNESVSEELNIKEFLLTALSYKYYYIISFGVFIAAAFLTNKFSSSVYELSTTISPVNENRSSLLSQGNVFGGISALSDARNLENDIESLKSFSIVSSTLNQLNLEVGYFKESQGIFKQGKELYNESPFTVKIDKSHRQPIYIKFNIQPLNDNSFRLTASGENVGLYNYVDNTIESILYNYDLDTICRFNETISNDNLKFSVSYNNDIKQYNQFTNSNLYFEFYHLDELTSYYLYKLKIEKINPKTSLIRIRITGKNVELIFDFLNKFIDTYLNENLGKKNKIAINTINFIDSQISEISDSLAISESKLRDYRSANQVMDLSYQGQKALEQMTQLEVERTSLQVQERYYNYILDYFNKNQDMAGLAPPSAANVSDPIMNQLILELLALNGQKSTILSNNAEKNLFLGQIENKIKLQKQAIIENVTNNLNTLNLTQNELNYRTDKLSKEISKLPRTELNMVSMQRKFNLSDAIYTFLLQKRSEAAITMASNYPDYEILESARINSAVEVSPKRMLNWMVAIFLGVLIPSLYIIMKDFFNETITSKKVIETIINRPVLCLIYSNTYKNDTVVFEKPGSAISESFRNLRSSIFLKLKTESKKVLLITSTQPKDGKSFISFNLASSIASVGYKTILIDVDLRRPTLHTYLNDSNSKGLSNFLTNQTPINEIIQETFVKSLDFIAAGPVPPNPSELIESGGLEALIVHLKKQYDYIIIDTTPVGIVADSLLISKYADQILLVCRNNYTREDIFTEVIDKFHLNGLVNFDVIFNDINFKKSNYGRYNTYYTQA